MVKDTFSSISDAGGPKEFVDMNLIHYKAYDVGLAISVETELLQHARTHIIEYEQALERQRSTPRSPVFVTPGAGACAGAGSSTSGSPAPRTPIFESPGVSDGSPGVSTPRSTWGAPGPSTSSAPRPRSSHSPTASSRPASSTSQAYTAALPVRTGTSTPRSRGAVRTSAMQMMAHDSGAVGLQQAAGEADSVRLLDVVRSDRESGATRGRMFKLPGQLTAGLQLVKRKLRTSRLRTDFHSDSSVVVDDDAEGEEGEQGEQGEQEGMGDRAQKGVSGAEVGLPHEPGWVREMPAEKKQLVGHRVAALYNNMHGRLTWYDAVVVDHMERRYNRGTSVMYQLWFEEDYYDEWYSLPDDTVIYRPNNKPSVSEFKQALAACQG